ncbi:hypothetical protein ACHHV8_23165 [Paenibacillus sp. TAB 01]|uniref:hypothetical protein n=1 Tax=Paenibacillus sp. TAB 01 TaxID=3368988 RepID=UPI00375280BC
MLHSFTRNKITLQLVLLALCLLLAIVGCSPAAQPQANSSPASGSAHPEEVVLAAPRDLAPGPQDAYYTSTILYVWEPLITASEDGQPAPKLAKSWTMSQDGKE